MAITRQSGHHGCAVGPSRLYEYYDAIDDFCIRLRARHLDAWADQLTSAKSGGSTSGEILSTTGAALRALVDQETDPDLRDEASRLLSECDVLWRT